MFRGALCLLLALQCALTEDENGVDKIIERIEDYADTLGKGLTVRIIFRSGIRQSQISYRENWETVFFANISLPDHLRAYFAL